jgi:hypothetical protein
VLDLKNKCLISKWLFKLLNEEGVWQELLRNKYLHSKSLAEVTIKPTDSPFWKGLMRVKEDFFNRGSFNVGNREETRFWEDTWLGNKPLAEQYPSLYNIVQRLMVVQLNNEKDVFVCDLTTNVIFTVKSMYLDLLDDDTKYLKSILENERMVRL